MSLPSWLQSRESSILICIRVVPRASRNEIVGPLGQELKIKIAAPPVDSAANDELVRYVAGLLDCPRSSVSLFRGASSRSKIIQVTGLTAETAAQRLQAHL
jgi:uncharacterized protein (TIGR00251 family)